VSFVFFAVNKLNQRPFVTIKPEKCPKKIQVVRTSANDLSKRKFYGMAFKFNDHNHESREKHEKVQ